MDEYTIEQLTRIADALEALAQAHAGEEWKAIRERVDDISSSERLQMDDEGRLYPDISF